MLHVNMYMQAVTWMKSFRGSGLYLAASARPTTTLWLQETGALQYGSTKQTAALGEWGSRLGAWETSLDIMPIDLYMFWNIEMCVHWIITIIRRIII